MATNKSLCAKCKYGKRYGSSYFCYWKCRPYVNDKKSCVAFVEPHEK